MLMPLFGGDWFTRIVQIVLGLGETWRETETDKGKNEGNKTRNFPNAILTKCLLPKCLLCFGRKKPTKLAESLLFLSASECSQSLCSYTFLHRLLPECICVNMYMHRYTQPSMHKYTHTYNLCISIYIRI